MPHPPRLLLHILQGPKQGSSIDCPCSSAAGITLGRARTSTFQIKDNAISQKHVALQWIAEQGSWTLTDAGSSNGTRVNDVVVGAENPIVLNNGDIIKIGADTTIRAEILFPQENNTEGAAEGVLRKAESAPSKHTAAGSSRRRRPARGKMVAPPAKVSSPAKNNLPQKKATSMDEEDITVREWFAQMIERIPQSIYEASESIVDQMMLRSQQFEEYLQSER